MNVEDGASTEEERVYGETRSGAIPRIGAEVAGSARRRNGRLAAVANGRLGGRPRAGASAQRRAKSC